MAMGKTDKDPVVRCFCSAGGDRQACNSERKQVGRRLLLCLCVKERERRSVSQRVREGLANEGDVEKRPKRGEGESHVASWGGGLLQAEGTEWAQGVLKDQQGGQGKREEWKGEVITATMKKLAFASCGMKWTAPGGSELRSHVI